MKTTASTIEILESRIAPATIFVFNTNDSGLGSLRQAIIDADIFSGPDTIVFHAGVTGTIKLTSGELLIDPVTKGDTLTIVGPGANKITIDANNASRIFDIDDGVSATDSPATISGLTLIHGNGTGTNASGNGGAIYSGEPLTLKNCTISGNSGSHAGGGIFSDRSLTLKNCKISGNTAPDAGGVSVISLVPGATVNVTNCMVSGNNATSNGYGGGLELLVDKAIVVSGSTIIGNSATNRGGGIYAGVTNSSTATGITISNDTIAANTAPNGGGVSVRDFNIAANSTISISKSIISGNTATSTLASQHLHRLRRRRLRQVQRQSGAHRRHHPRQHCCNGQQRH